MVNKKKIIVVLGMHRSGTSALTRALKVLGVDLGDNLMPPIDNINDKGFFEDLDINKFNDYLLNKLNCIWCSPQIPQNNQLHILNNSEDIETAIDLLNNKINNVTIFGFKDPRVSVLLPFWQKIFKILNLNVNYLIAIRNPLDVAKSLNKRDDFPLTKSLFLWGQYMIDSLEFTEQQSRILVSYEDLMQDPNLQLQKISRFLDLTIDSKELDIYIKEFLDISLQHGNASLNDLQNININFIIKLYSYLLDSSNNKNEQKIKFLDIKNDFNNEIEFFLKDLNFQDLLIKKIKHLDNNIIHFNYHINDLYNDKEILSNKIDNLHADNDKLNEIICKLLNDKEILNININDLTNDKLMLQMSLEDVNFHLNERLNIINNLLSENTNLNARIKSNATHIEFIENNLSNLQNSYSMKITKPIRFLIKFLKNLFNYYKL